jgi:hypothetical protein
MTPTEKKAHHAARLRAIYENKKQPRPEDMMTPEDLVNKYEPGHPSYQLGQVLKNYRIGDGGMTFDDFKMEKPVAYEYLKKNHSMAFHDMQGDMARFEEKGRRKEEWAEWEKKEMAPHKAAIAERYANLKEKADEDRFFEEEQKRLDWDAKTQKEMSRLANFGLPGWEKGMPRVIVGQMMADWGNNNTVEKQWVDGNYSDEEKEGYTYSDEDVMRDSDAYFKTVFGSLQAEAGARHINPDAIKESAQNLRHLVNVVAEEKGFYSQKNPTGITTEQLSKMNSSIDNNMNFALQGYQTTDEVEKARMAQVEQESKMASKVREEAIKNMEPEQKKEPVSNKLAKFAGSLLFGQKGGYVALQEGGPVSLNNSRRLFNLARRKYA